jgi:hypothetical protein
MAGKRAKRPLPDVRVGQVWKDNDKRMPERYLRVMRVEGGFSSWFAFCKRAGTPNFEPIPEAREVRIAFERFRPTSTGYALVE